MHGLEAERFNKVDSEGWMSLPHIYERLWIICNVPYSKNICQTYQQFQLDMFHDSIWNMVFVGETFPPKRR
jgi:hypothetical protein